MSYTPIIKIDTVNKLMSKAYWDKKDFRNLTAETLREYLEDVFKP